MSIPLENADLREGEAPAEPGGGETHRLSGSAGASPSQEVALGEKSLVALHVCSFESRRGPEMKALIERHGGIATIAPSMREIPLDDSSDAFKFAQELFEQKIDVVIFMTGVGATALLGALETRYSRSEVFAALERAIIVVRGPKPTAVLRGWGVRIDYRAPEPNTWREVLGLFDASIPALPQKGVMPQKGARPPFEAKPLIPLKERRVAVQEYGQPSVELYREFESRGASVLPVTVYHWALPVDVEPLKLAIQKTIAGEHDVLMFTSAQQLTNVLQVADQIGLRDAWLDAANRRCVVASIGPTASAALKAGGLRVDVEPSHPNMGTLVKETLSNAGSIVSKGG